MLIQVASAASNNQYVPARYVVLAEEIQNEIAVKYAKKFQMELVSAGAGLIDKVNILGLDFHIRGPLSQERLREILVDCVEGFLLTLNSNGEIRPFLKTHPFTAEGIDIGIFVKDSSGKKRLYYPSIGFANACDGKIIYRFYDPESEYLNDKEEIEEAYQDALKIVKDILPNNPNLAINISS